MVLKTGEANDSKANEMCGTARPAAWERKNDVNLGLKARQFVLCASRSQMDGPLGLGYFTPVLNPARWAGLGKLPGLCPFK